MGEVLQLGNLAVDVVFKDIKNVHLSVYPPDGRVTLTAPTATRLDVARAYAISKIGWIRVPGGAVLEIFEFQPQLPPDAIPWNRVEFISAPLADRFIALQTAAIRLRDGRVRNFCQHAVAFTSQSLPNFRISSIWWVLRRLGWQTPPTPRRKIAKTISLSPCAIHSTKL